MFSQQVVPLLEKTRARRAAPRSSICRIYRAVSIGESQVEALVGAELEKIAGPGDRLLRATGRGGPALHWRRPEVLERAEAVVLPALGKYLLSPDARTMEGITRALLLRERVAARLSVAESCTGGLLANRLTNVPGASAVFIAGMVTYADAR